MKKILFALFAIVAVAISTLAQTPIGTDDEHKVMIAVFAVAHDFEDDEITDEQSYCNVMLAREVIGKSSGLWKAIAYQAQAARPSGEVDWSAVTFAQVETNITAIWPMYALARFGTTPVVP